MPFSNIEVTREKLDAFEGATLERHSATTVLGLSDNDPEMSVEAQTEVKLDILDKTNRLLHGGHYDTSTQLLNDLSDADKDSMIARLMALKFLEMFFGDQHIGEGDGGQKAAFYESKYNKELPQVVSSLTSKLDPPQKQNVVKFRR